MNHPLRCRCGKLQGHVERPGMAVRAVCYCRDCQAYARFLGRADTVLEGHGGTGIVATLPRHVHFSQGLDALACMSLSDRGMLRWYAGCCKTPIANTPRDAKTPYAGLVEACLASASPSLEQSFGPVRMVLNTGSAHGHVKGAPVATLLGMVRIMKSVLPARLTGGWKRNPFFRADTGAPVVAPRELTPAERTQYTNTA